MNEPFLVSSVRPVAPWVAALFMAAAGGVLGPAGWRLYRDAHRLHGLRDLTPALLNGGEPVLRAAPQAVLRAADPTRRFVTFRLLAPSAQSVFVGGTFNDFDAARAPLVRGPDGLWEATLDLPPGTHEYKFKVDGRWEIDPANPERTPAPRECSLLEVPS